MSLPRFLPILGALLLLACDESAFTRAAPPAPRASTTAPTLATSTTTATSATAAPAESNARPSITFVRDGKTVRVIPRDELEAAIAAERWTAFDPYYNKPKTYRALPLAPLVERGFGEPAASLAQHDYVLRALDGYAVPLSGAKVFEDGGYVAVADVEVAGWEPIGQQRANPGPFYLVWKKPTQHDLATHPRPWQLASIEIAPFEATYPYTAPTGVIDTAALAGFRLFREQCIACHAINREGGRVGPDLNVPQSIVEYRPEPQIRAYIRDPRTFRYSTMPAHPAFTERDLDALLAYFRAMKARKHDPEAGK